MKTELEPEGQSPVNTADTTIILLTLNRPRFLPDALNGLSSQTRKSWKLIISDCTDDPQYRPIYETIYEEFVASHSDNDVKVIKQPKRLSNAAHIAAVLKEVDTPFVALLDDDDIWLPHHLEESIGWLEQDARRGLTISNAHVIDGDGVRKGISHDPNQPVPNPENIRGWLGLHLRTFYGSASGYVLRNEALKDHVFLMDSSGDLQLGVSVSLAGYQTKALTTPTFLYRVHNASLFGYDSNRIMNAKHGYRIALAKKRGFITLKQYPLFALLVLKSIANVIRLRYTAKADIKS